MFDIEYKGANALIFTTKNVKVVFDPRLSLVGKKDLSVEDVVEVLTEDRFASTVGNPRVQFDGPGEYEVADVGLAGFPAQRHIDAGGNNSTIYKLLIGGVRIAVLGNIDPKLSEEQLEQIGVTDIVVLPVGGGGYTLDATAAAVIVKQIDPRVVIPVHYSDPELAYEVPQDVLDTFLKEVGASGIDAGTKWKVKSAEALPEQLTVVKIDRS